MARRTNSGDPVVEKLDRILAVLQDLLILECSRAGMKWEDLRGIVGVDNNRISRITRHVKSTAKGAKEN